VVSSTPNFPPHAASIACDQLNPWLKISIARSVHSILPPHLQSYDKTIYLAERTGRTRSVVIPDEFEKFLLPKPK